MAADLWPYSGRQGGRVADGEHEALWSTLADGLLPGQDGEALAVYLHQQAGGVQVQPGRLLIAGHVLALDKPATVQVAPNSEKERVDLVVARIDRSKNPWTYGVGVRAGVPGEGRPSPQHSIESTYEVPLRAVIRRTDGALDLAGDERPWLVQLGRKATGAELTLPGSLRAKAGTEASVHLVELAGLRVCLVRGLIERRDGKPFTSSQLNGGILARIPAAFRTTGATWNAQLSLAGTTNVTAARLDLGRNGELRIFSAAGTSNWVGINGFYQL